MLLEELHNIWTVNAVSINQKVLACADRAEYGRGGRWHEYKGGFTKHCGFNPALAEQPRVHPVSAGGVFLCRSPRWGQGSLLLMKPSQSIRCLKVKSCFWYQTVLVPNVTKHFLAFGFSIKSWHLYRQRQIFYMLPQKSVPLCTWAVSINVWARSHFFLNYLQCPSAPSGCSQHPGIACEQQVARLCRGTESGD